MGSSASSSLRFLLEHASAIMIRCSCPWLNWNGYEFSLPRPSMPTPLSKRRISSSYSLRLRSGRCRLSTRRNWLPMVKDGLKELIGSWKIIAISPPRMRRLSSGLSDRRSRPSSTISSATTSVGGRSMPRIAFSAVLLPDPLSPTKPTISPGLTVSENSFTAGTFAPRNS